MFCIKCGTQQPQSSAFCIKCGEKIVVEEASQPSVEPTPQAPMQPIPQQYAQPTYQQPTVVTPKNKPNIAVVITVAVLAVVSIVIMIMLFGGGTGGGGGRDMQLVGTWETIGFGYTFEADGQGERNLYGTIQAFTWTTRGDIVRLTSSAGIQEFGYSINGNILRITERATAYFWDLERVGGGYVPTYATANPYPGEIVFNGVPVSRFHNITRTELVNTLGQPISQSVTSIEGWNVDELEYQGARFTFEVGATNASMAWFDIWALELDGVPLSSVRNDILSIFGSPLFEGWMFIGWGMEYDGFTFWGYQQPDGSIPYRMSYLQK